MANPKRILSVKLVREVDTDPDLSHLGEYSNTASSPAAIDRQARGDYERGRYRWFNPAMTGEETGNPDSPEQDYRRMEDYNRGSWWMVGIWAEARVILTGDVAQTVRSGGLWGIESDSDEDHFNEVEAEELASLRTELKAMGFTSTAIKRAFAAHKVKVGG